MSKRLVIFVGLACLIDVTSSSELHAKMKIPEKREFPTSKKITACQDFYEYSCSEVSKAFKLPKDRSAHNFAFNDSRERMLQAKTEYLHSLQTKPAETPRAKTLQTVFSACMDAKGSAAEEITEVTRLMREVEAIKDRKQLQEYFASKMYTADFRIFGFDWIPNLDDPSIRDLYIWVDGMNLPERSYYQDKKVIKDYKALVKAFFEQLKIKSALPHVEKIIEIETKLAEALPLPAERRQIYSSRTELKREYIRSNLAVTGLDSVLAKIPEKTLIRNFHSKAYDFIAALLEKENIDSIKYFYLFKAARTMMDDAYPKYFKKEFDFDHKHLGGPPERSPRDERCTKSVMSSYDKEIDAELVDVLFKSFPNEKIERVVGKVRDQLTKSIQENTWLSPDARKAAIEKIKTAKLFLSKPKTVQEWRFNPVVEVDPHRPYTNERRLQLAWQAEMFDRLKTPIDPTEWAKGPLTVNAWYQAAQNKFTMPIGILQYPFFDTSAPDEVNLGSAGAIVGHELGHGIDDQGSKYDNQGRLRTWMSDKDLLAFGQRGASLIKQFDELKQNGLLSLGENIGDMVGLRTAYEAAFPEGKGDLELKKSFFLSYARVWCQVIRPDFAKNLIKTDPHPMGFARTNAQVVHVEGFYEAYGCKEGDKMYLEPNKRIKIW